jgi:hypothetical protein
MDVVRRTSKHYLLGFKPDMVIDLQELWSKRRRLLNAIASSFARTMLDA